MTAEHQQIDEVAWILGRLREAAPEIARDVAADLGDEVTSEVAEPVVHRFLAAVAAGGVRVGEADLVRLRAEGAGAAREGRPLASPIDAYLSTAWVAWDHALRIAPTPGPAVLGQLGAALMRAGDDIAAALADGFTAAERALASTAGAARQAVLEELLTPGVAHAATIARLARRATLVGLDPTLSCHLLVLRPDAAADMTDELVEELGRRLARDPVRRPHLVARRATDVIAIAATPWRDDVAFGEALEGLSPGSPWWGVVAGPVLLDGLAAAYADTLDALRVLPAVGRPWHAVPVAEVALERAITADPPLAAAGVDRWLGPLERSGRGGPGLVRTVETWLAAGGSVMASSRMLGVAPRTVSYRLERVASLLGVTTLDPDIRARLSVAILVRRLLQAQHDSMAGPGQLGSGR